MPSGHYTTLETRRRIIDCHLRGYSHAAIGRAMGISPEVVRYWVRRYKNHGNDGLHTPPQHKAYPPWVRQRIAELAGQRLSAYRIAQVLTPEVYPDGAHRVKDWTVSCILEELEMI